jgi:hypothetical protein
LLRHQLTQRKRRKQTQTCEVRETTKPRVHDGFQPSPPTLVQ